MKYLYNSKMLFFGLVLGLFACEDDETPKLRSSLDYNSLTAETPYSEPFVDADGATTVDLSEGHQRYKMFQALNYQMSSSISGNTQIDATKLKNMFSNTNNPFVDISTSTISVSGAELNNADVELRNTVAASRPSADAEVVRARIETLFDEVAAASASVTTPASQGVAGKLGSYLVDAKGIEISQVIQKSLIGALQLDYISNVLLDEGLTADNSKTVSDKNYSELEHNWDVAYGLLTLNPIYLQGATNETRNTVEFALGSYLWEYNKANFAKFHPAFLRGRAAVVNNDIAEMQAQATFIRTEMEKTIANAAVGYLDKWKTAVASGSNSADAVRAHAIAEGLGFIYSLRFATIHNADAAFSDQILNNLIGSANGFWDLDVTMINAASEAIKTKFGI